MLGQVGCVLGLFGSLVWGSGSALSLALWILEGLSIWVILKTRRQPEIAKEVCERFS